MINKFGSTLMALRSANHDTVGKMAEKLGIERMMLTSIEIGREAVPEGLPEKIAEVYNLSDDELASLKEESKFTVDKGFGIDNAQGGFEFSQDRQITQAQSNEIAQSKN